MSIRNKVSVVNAIQYPTQLKRFIAEGNDDTLAGFFANGNLAWIVNGGKLALIDPVGGCPRPVYEFGERCKEAFYVTCVEELHLSCSSPTPLLLIGGSSLYQSQICVFNPATCKVLRAIQINDIQVRCIVVVDNGASCLNSLTDILSNMDGIIAVGCADGSVLLIDLNKQQLMKAHHGNALYRSTESSPQQVKFINLDWEEETITAEIYETSRNGMSAAITLIEGDKTDTEFGVTALSFSKETACLYIGYSSGLWQIWNLSLPTFKLMYECAECTSPVSNFCHIEPCEDPRPTLYLTVNHDGTETSMPLFNMYSMSYSSKHHIDDYGSYYQDFISCNLSFSMSPGEDCGNVVSGRLVNSASCSKNIKRSILQNMGLPEMEGIQMKLVFTAYSLTYARSSTHTFLCVFDLDQWYKEQMPPTPDVDSSYVEIIELSSEPLLTSALVVDSFSLYHSDEPQEIHLVPRALSFKVLGLSETSIVLFDKVGQQQLWLSNTEIIGAKSLVSPSKLFHACVSAGFLPTFPIECNVETSSPTNDEMRSYILSVCLDNGRSNVILEAVELWENGAYAGSNCTLNFLFDWAWGSVSSAYKCFTNICKLLFSSSNDIGASMKRRMQHSRLVLDWLHFIFVKFLTRYNNPLYKDTLEQRLKALEIINLFVHQVSWFMNVGLLPESNSLKGSPSIGVSYDYAKLNHLAEERRQYLNDLSVKLKKKGSLLNLTGAGLYLADCLIQDYSEVGNQWDDEGGTIAYPPPSIQSLLRSLRHQYVPVSKKMAIVLYTLLDLVNILNKEKHENLISKVDTFHLLPQVTDGQTNTIKGLWHLDHSLYEEGLQYLFHHSITTLDLSESLHRGILLLLYIEGKADLALQYLRFKKPSLNLPEDLKLEMSILLARDLVNEAYHFQKKHTFLRETLLRQLLTECLCRGSIGRVVSLPLDNFELSFFDHYLEKNRSQQNDDLRILLLLSRSKYNEAKMLHERLKALNRLHDALQLSNRDLIVKGFTHSLSNTSKEMYLQKLDPNLKTLPQFKSSKPRPLSVYIKTLDDHGLPNFVLPTKQLSSLTVAASINLHQFAGYNKHSTNLLWDQGEKQQTHPLVSPEEPLGAPSRKRTAAWIPGGNKRTKLDEEAIARDESIAAFVGTPLVKRRSKEIHSETPHDSRHLTQVHSILKSGKTPGTPGKYESVLNVDEQETPKKTLRWNLPGDSARKIHVRKSLLSSSIQSSTEKTSSQNFKESPNNEKVIGTPDSIRSRLRSRSTSSKKEDLTMWTKIEEDAKPKVLFAVDLPSSTGKTPQSLKQPFSTRKRLTSTQKQVWEKLVLKLPNFSGIEDKMETCASPTDDAGNKVGEDESSGEGITKSSKNLKFMNVEIDSNEVSLCNLSGSPFTSTNFSEDLWEKIKTKASDARNTGNPVSQESEMPLADSVPIHSKAVEIEVTIQSSDQGTPIHQSYQLDNNKFKPSPSSSVVGINSVPDVVVSSLECTEPKVDHSTTTTHSVQPIPEPPIIDKPSLHEHDSLKKESLAEDELVEDAKETKGASESSSLTGEYKSNSAKDTSTVFVPQHLPEIATVVSLARGHYPEDEDEEESEDPEEAEIPPAIEFAQPEEGLVIDATFSVADKELVVAAQSESQNSSNDDNTVDDSNHSSGVLNTDAGIEENESDSSVICLDSESDDEPVNQTTVRDYEDYGDESTNSASRNRSFFHDKYSSKQEGEVEQGDDEPPSQVSSTDGDEEEEEEGEERDSSEVDIYNMDDADNEDEVPDVLEDELFELGRGIQKSDNRESDSESGQDDDEEEDGEEDDVDKEKANDPPECQIDSGTSSSYSSKGDPEDNIVDKEYEEGLVVISSDERDEESVSRQSTQSGEGASLERPIVSESDEPHHVTEDQAAVNALLISDAAEVDCIKDDKKGCNVQLEPQNNVGASERSTSMSPTKVILKETEGPKKSEVIDILNLSQGQMFFGSPFEAEVFNESLERALFQLGTTKAADDNPDSDSTKDSKCESDKSKMTDALESDNSQDEQLVLKVDPEDVSCEEIVTERQSEENLLNPRLLHEKNEERHQTCRNSSTLLEVISDEQPQSTIKHLDNQKCKGVLDQTKIGKLVSAGEAKADEMLSSTVEGFLCSDEPMEEKFVDKVDLNNSDVEEDETKEEIIIVQPPTPFKTAQASDKRNAQSVTDTRSLELVKDVDHESNNCQVTIGSTDLSIHMPMAIEGSSLIIEPIDERLDNKVELNIPSIEGNTTVAKEICSVEPKISLKCPTLDVQCGKSVACQITCTEPVAYVRGVDSKSFSCQANMEQTEIMKTNLSDSGGYENKVELNVTKFEENVDQAKEKVLQPPTPFKNVGLVQPKNDESASGTPQESTNPTSGDSTPLNPFEVAFVGGSSSSNTPSMTPVRKSIRIKERVKTPGRCLVPQEDVAVSYALLDLAAIGTDLKLDAPALVDKSVITDNSSLAQKPGKVHSSKRSSSKMLYDGDHNVKTKRSRRSSSEPKDIDMRGANKNLRDKPLLGHNIRASSAEPSFDSQIGKEKTALSRESEVLAKKKQSNIEQIIIAKLPRPVTNAEITHPKRDSSIPQQPLKTTAMHRIPPELLEVVFDDSVASNSQLMTPVRKSLRIKERAKTPGGPLDPLENVVVSQPSMDVPAVGTNLIKPPAKVDKSAVTNKLLFQSEESKKMEKYLKDKPSSSKASHDHDLIVKTKRIRRSSSGSKSSAERKRVEEKDLPLSGDNHQPSLVQPSYDSQWVEQKFIHNVEAHLDEDNKHLKNQHKRSAEDSEEADSLTKDNRRRRSTSLQPEGLSGDYRTEKHFRKHSQHSNDGVSEEIDQLATRRRKSRRSSSVPLESNEPVEEKMYKSRSSLKHEHPSVVSPSSKRSNSTRSVDSLSQSESKSEAGKVSTTVKSKRSKHSITEPLGKKKSTEEQKDIDLESANRQSKNDSSTSSGATRRRRKARSLHEYPMRNSVMPPVMESIEELPENSPQPTAHKADYDGIVSAVTKRWDPKPMDISKWLSLNPSQFSFATKRRATSYFKTNKTSSIFGPSSSLQSPAKSKSPEEDISPTSSVVSNASSKVLRSGRTIEENTPKSRGTKLSSKRRSSKLLEHSLASPAKILRSGRSIGSEDGLSAVSQSEEEDNDGSSVNTSISSAVSGPIDQEPVSGGVTIEEIMSTRRLTRHQRAVLERSMSSSRRGVGPTDSPLATPLDQE